MLSVARLVSFWRCIPVQYNCQNSSNFQCLSHFSRIFGKNDKIPGFFQAGKTVTIFPGFPGAAYHSQGNGQCERFNSTLCNMLGTLSEEEKSDWKSYLGCMTRAYNCTKHASTTYSPYFLMFSRHHR